jgi:hypothetical protein
MPQPGRRHPRPRRQAQLVETSCAQPRWPDRVNPAAHPAQGSSRPVLAPTRQAGHLSALWEARLKFGTALDRTRHILDGLAPTERSALLVSLVTLYGIRSVLIREHERERRADHRSVVRDTRSAGVPDSVPDTTVVSTTSRDAISKATTRKLPADVPDKTKPDAAAAIDEYRRLFRSLHGSEPVIRRPQDPVNITRIVSQYGLEKTRDLLAQFFKSDDVFIQNAGHSIGVFSSVLNKLLSANGAHPPASKKYTNDLWKDRPGGEVRI